MPNFTHTNRESRTKLGKTTEIYSLFDNIIIQLTTELHNLPTTSEHINDVRKAVVNLNLQSQSLKATVSAQKIAKLLLNIAILSHSQPRCSVANQSQCKLQSPEPR